MKTLSLMAGLLVTVCFAGASEALLKDIKTILVLGDSITQAGQYVTNFDAWLVRNYPERRFTVINAGVASETISGLSEENHAGGRFPRPDLHERLERVLKKTQPELIIACYGMNCGIYQPLDDKRFQAYKNGQIKLRKAAIKHGAVVVHVTPPVYDNHGNSGFDYDEVLGAYSKWLVSQREQGWHVIDLHREMRAKLDARKQEEPKFTVQRDKVHPNALGHWMMAQSLITYFGDEESTKLEDPTELLGKPRLVAVKQRMQLYQRAIHAETQPKRPGVPQEGTLQSAASGAQQLSIQIYGR